MRVVPRENFALNGTWIADRERYSYLGLYHADRVTKPMIRVKGEWQTTDWQTALEFAVKGLQDVISAQGADQIGALASPNSTTEEFFLLQKIWRQLGSSNIDHRLRQVDFSDQDSFALFPTLEGTVADLENYSSFLFVGSNLQKEQPLAAVRVRKATLKGASVAAVNMMDYKFNFKIADKKIVAPHDFVYSLAGIAKALLPSLVELADVSVSEQDRLIAERLRTGEKTAILLGALALNHPEAAKIRWLAQQIAAATKGTLALLTEGGNAAGAWIAGAIPHRTAVGDKVQHEGLDALSMLQQARQAYLLLNVEPELDCANPVAALEALAAAKFVVSLSVFKNPALERVADVILPVTPFTETAGTFVNVTGQWQSFRGVATPYEQSRPAWKVLRVMGNLFHLQGFDYEAADEVLHELKLAMQHSSLAAKECKGSLVKKNGNGLSRIGEIPIYSGDGLVRRAEALQKTQVIIEGELAAVRVHPKTAEELGLSVTKMARVKQNGSEVKLPVVIDERVPLQAVFIAGGIMATKELGELFGMIEVLGC
jgi:NADH-quinone oxidoreductase subunit G